MKIRCIAIDDEPKALDLIKLYCDKVNFLALEKAYRDSIKALEYLQDNTTDLIFLDINMPDLNGIEFIQSLNKVPIIIFTTAYSEFAVESYEYKAVDYLLKPITFSRFLKAANNALEHYRLTNCGKQQKNSKNRDFTHEHILVRSGKETHKLNVSDVLYVEGAQNYVMIYLSDFKVITLMRMKEMEDVLPAELFIRIHKSYIVNFKRITKIEPHQVGLQDIILPIGKVYRESFRKFAGI